MFYEQVIGIHKGMNSGKEYNLGSFLKFPLLEINPNYNKASNQKQNNFNKKNKYNTIKKRISNSSVGKKNVNNLDKNKVNNYNINEYANKNNYIETFNDSFSKLNIEFSKKEDIISDSLCGMKNISYTCYINK